MLLCPTMASGTLPRYINRGLTLVHPKCCSKSTSKGFVSRSFGRSSHSIDKSSIKLSFSFLPATVSTYEESSRFPYERHFASKIDIKKQDKSYRYFRNINRVVNESPLAHTPEGKIVTVWCSVDYVKLLYLPLSLFTNTSFAAWYGE